VVFYGHFTGTEGLAAGNYRNIATTREKPINEEKMAKEKAYIIGILLTQTPIVPNPSHSLALRAAERSEGKFVMVHSCQECFVSLNSLPSSLKHSL